MPVGLYRGRLACATVSVSGGGSWLAWYVPVPRSRWGVVWFLLA
jgi:hypothetical protein